MKGNGSAEVVEGCCVPVLSLVQARNHCSKTVVVVYVTMQAMFGGVKPLVRPLLSCFAGCLVQARAGVCVCCWQKS